MCSIQTVTDKFVRLQSDLLLLLLLYLHSMCTWVFLLIFPYLLHMFRYNVLNGSWKEGKWKQFCEVFTFIPSGTIHEYKCSAQIILLSSNTVLQNGKSPCTCMLIILTFWHTDIVQAIPNQLRLKGRAVEPVTIATRKSDYKIKDYW